MGAEPSKVGETLPRPRSIRRLPSTFHSRLVAGWQQRHLRTQFFATVRHTERADSWGALVDGQRWITTEDFRRWGPIDPPLSDEGLVAAGVAGKRLRMAAEDAGADIHVVVSSPYFRCVQTAVEICRELGDGARMLLDSSLGEIYGPSVMGQDEPAGSTRPTEMLLEYCRSRGVRCPDRAVGRQPVWPETLNRARLRFAGRFLEYVHRGTKAQRNFVIVSHADCVGAALRLMPSHADRVVQRAEFGAMFLAQRSTLAPASVSASPGGSIDASPGGCLDMEASPGNSEGAMPPPVPDGWQVQTFDLWLRKKLSGHNTIKDNLRALAQGSRMTEGRVAQLLSELADEPLEEIDSGVATADRKELYREGFLRGGSRISVSTFLFGASDVGNMSDVAGSCSRTTSMDRSEMTMSRGNSLQSPKLKRHLRHKGTGSFEEGVVDRLTALGGGASRQTDGVDRSACRQNTAPSPVAEEGCQPEDAELLSPSARVPERAERACDMSGSKLFQRRFPGRSGLEQNGASALGAAQAPQVASSGCCGSSRAATQPEVELLGPGKSLLLQRRAGEGIPATKLGAVRTLRMQL